MSGVDKNAAGFFHHVCSGAPVALIGRKGNPVRLAVSAASQIRSCPRNCRRRVLLQFATGLQGLGRRRRIKTREPGDLPEHVILPPCGARARGGLPLW